MSEDPRRPSGSLPLVLVLVGIGLVTFLYGTIQLGTWITYSQWIPGHPLQVLALPIRGQLVLTETHLIAAVVLLIAFCLPLILWARYRARRRKSGAAIDRNARHLGVGQTMSWEAAQHKAIVGQLTAQGVPAGLLIGRTVLGNKDLVAAWREGIVVMMGPGGGKTTALAVPMICEAPGLVVATSNKRDLADAVIEPRRRKGAVWVFDPQFLAGNGAYTTAPWFWNPLTYVRDEVKAAALAKLFATASRDQTAKTDAYWDSAAQGLLADLLLAAAVSNQPITQVYLWLMDQHDETPINALENTHYRLPAASLRGAYQLPDKQRGGVFDSAAKMVQFLNNGYMASWIERTNNKQSEFDHRRFAQSDSDTLLSLSKEGDGTAGPLTTALTVAVTEAVEERASRMPRGRLRIPALLMLDEAANTCRWHELPAQYSHYGSRGMMLVTILQNWAQGERAWRREGIEQLWSAATIRIIGPGLADVDHLRKVVEMAGDRHVTYYSQSSSSGRGGGNSSMGANQHREKKLSVSDLTEMEHGRMLVIPAADRVVLAKQVPWWERPMRAEVQDSIAKMEPAA